MQYIDNREDQEVIDMVNRNHRLNVEVTRTVGYIVPVEEARRIAAQRAAANQQQGSIVGVVAAFPVQYAHYACKPRCANRDHKQSGVAGRMAEIAPGREPVPIWRRVRRTVPAGADLAPAKLWRCITVETPILSFFSNELVHCFDLGEYKSLRWRPMYDKIGEFELHTSPSLFAKVKCGQLILRPDRPKETVKVEGIDIESGNLIITGRFLTCIMEDAGIRNIYNFDCPIEEAMRTLVKEQYGRVTRALPVKLAAAGGFTPTIQCQVSLKNLFTVLAAMAKAGGLGFRVYADPAVQALFFEVYEGVDRTEGQEENARVTFSNAYFNIDDPKYQENEANYKNYAIVCGAGEGLDRTIVEVDRTSGEDRRELLVDARDLSQGEQTEDEYKAILTQRGHDKLDEHNRIQSFEAGIKSSSQFRYTEDWNLGDIVTGRQTEWGVSMDQRVTEVEEIYENDTMTVVPTLGTPAPETYNLEDNIA